MTTPTLTIFAATTDPPTQPAPASGFLRCGNKRPYGECQRKILTWDAYTVELKGDSVRVGIGSGDVSFFCPMCRKRHRFSHEYLKELTKPR